MKNKKTNKYISKIIQVIESDPEDDDDVEPPLHKYTRPEGSTPTYNMDTDISTLEAPTFTTLSHKENVLQALKWDHQPTLIGTKVVNPILHVCDKCQHPIIRYGRLNCKHVLCHSCASGLMKEGLNCIRCNTKVTGVEEVGLGRLFVCSYGGSRLVIKLIMIWVKQACREPMQYPLLAVDFIMRCEMDGLSLSVCLSLSHFPNQSRQPVHSTSHNKVSCKYKRLIWFLSVVYLKISGFLNF